MPKKEYKQCPDCDAGYTPARVRLNSIVFLLLTSAEDALRGKNHLYFEFMDKNVGGDWTVADSSLAELTKGLANRGPDRVLGHDALDEFVAAKKIIIAAGLDPNTWGICKTCNGEAEIKIKK